MTRRTFLEIAGKSSLAFPFLSRSGWCSPDKPNIVFILADDMGVHQLGCYGSRFYETPRIDGLASEGIRFTDAYAAAPVCSPTRAAIMTGKYPARLHLTAHIPSSPTPYPYAKLRVEPDIPSLPLEEHTLAEMLRAHGYVTGHFGKWHLNKDKKYRLGRPGDPGSQGFDEVLTTKKPNSDETAAAGADPEYDAHHVDQITDRSLRFIEDHRSEPFFCYISHNTIHRPVMEYTPEIVKYAVKPDAGNRMGNNPVVGAMVERLDRSVGRVLDQLDALGIAENTIVVFYSDNGALFGREGRKPLYGAKADLYEGGVRVPLIVRWPGRVRPGTLSGELVSSIDFFPTFAEIAGEKRPEPAIDGISLLPVLLDHRSLGRDTLYWHYPHYHHKGIAPAGSIRRGKYKLIEWFEKSILEGPDAPGALELFDLERDPGETHNLAGERPELQAELYEDLKSWRETVRAQEMDPNPYYDPVRSMQKTWLG